MIKHTMKYGTALLLASFVAVSAFADDENADNTGEPTKLEKALEKYDRTGKIESCINPTRMRNSQVVDDYNIIFEESNSKAYLTTLKRKCNSLGFHGSILYEVRGSSICRGETFQVLNGTGMGGAICSFGDFELLTRKQKPADSEEPSQ